MIVTFWPRVIQQLIIVELTSSLKRFLSTYMIHREDLPSLLLLNVICCIACWTISHDDDDWQVYDLREDHSVCCNHWYHRWMSQSWFPRIEIVRLQLLSNKYPLTYPFPIFDSFYDYATADLASLRWWQDVTLCYGRLRSLSQLAI